jgi:hypothetical protein
MVAEIYGSLSALKTAFDVAKGLKDIHDATLRNAAIIELQEKILGAQEAQTSLIQRIGELEKQVTSFETWETEKEKYELKDLGYSSLAFMLKPGARGSVTPHFVCTNCYGKRQISVIQHGRPTPGAVLGFFCPSCGTVLRPGGRAFANGSIIWLD